MQPIKVEDLANLEITQEFFLDGEFIAIGSDKYKAFFAPTLAAIAYFGSLGNHNMADFLIEQHCKHLSTIPFRYQIGLKQ